MRSAGKDGKNNGRNDGASDHSLPGKAWWHLFDLAKPLVLFEPENIWGWLMLGILEATAPSQFANEVRAELADGHLAEESSVLRVDLEVLEVFEETQHPPGVEPPYSNRPSGRKRRKAAGRRGPWWQRGSPIWHET